MTYFITGTDTDVGKSIVAAWMMLHLDADYWKPIGSNICDDTGVVKSLTNLPEDRFHDETYLFQDPLSPNQAAEREGITIDLNQIHRPKTSRPLIVEGAGGLMVPLNERDLMIDLMKKLNIPVILVVRTTLGTLNHTLLSLEALNRRQIPIAGLVLNGPYHPANTRTLETHANVPIIAEIPYIGELSWQTLKSIPLNPSLINQKLAS